METTKTDDENSNDFDTILNAIGSNGPFQKRFHLIFNFFLIGIMTMPYLSLIMAMSVPDYHCHVPGRNYTDYTLSEWHALKLPKVRNSKTGLETISGCKMFISLNETSDCLHGWDYDPTWYSLTIPSMQNWICNSELYVTNTFVASRIGELVGIFTFGQLGDRVGRRPIFYIALTLLVLGRIGTVFTSHSYKLFLVAVVVGGSASISVFQTPSVIGMEVSGPEVRAHIAFLQCVSWVGGACLLPMLMWWLGDWRWLMIVSTIPACVAFFLFKLLPESPRWLASRGKIKKATEVLKYIAEINGTTMPEETSQILNDMASKKEKVYGMASVFSNLRLAKNAIILVTCWVVCGLSYYSLVLNVSNMAGNPFMNFFWQALIELPAYVVGRYLGNRWGRRWPHTLGYILAFFICMAIILSHGSYPWLLTALVTCVKFTFTISFYLLGIQVMEIYPTCIRQSGSSLGGIVSNIFGLLGPYIVYLGTSIDGRLPYAVMMGLTIPGMICSSMLPETLNKKLPETLHDSKTFGAEQKFWSFNETIRTKNGLI